MEELKALYPVCTHIKSDGIRCGSPALTGMNLCFQHIGGRTPSVAKAQSQTRSTNTPLKLVFPSGHEAIQHNLFLVMRALSDGKIDNATAITYNRLLRSSQLNLQRWLESKSEFDYDEVEDQMAPLPDESLTGNECNKETNDYDSAIDSPIDDRSQPSQLTSVLLNEATQERGEGAAVSSSAASANSKSEVSTDGRHPEAECSAAEELVLSKSESPRTGPGPWGEKAKEPAFPSVSSVPCLPSLVKNKNETPRSVS